MDDHSPLTDEIAAKFAIMELRAKYFRLMDTQDWEGLRELFIPEAIVDMRDAYQRMSDSGFSGVEGDGILRGRDAIIEMISSVKGLRTVHHGHMPEIEFRSATQATGIWAMEDIVRQTDEDGAVHEMHGYGHYHDDYVVDEHGRWRVSAVRITRLYVTMS